jgi:riboflavin synthase
MFSGIIEELAELTNISRRGTLTVLEIKADKLSEDTEIGDSISLNGVCLTVVKKNGSFFSFEVIPESLKLTNLGLLKLRDKVNLERSLKMGQRLSGHFVTGHVDCVGVIRRKGYLKGNLCLEVAIAQEFQQYCLRRGSIAVDGISLTIADKKSNAFLVNIIPHTLKNTTLGFKGPADKVNIEFDLLAKKGL